MMHWSLYVLIGAAVNTAVNGGYKLLSGKSGFYFIAASVLAVSALSLFGYAVYIKDGKAGLLLSGWTPAVIAGMGIGGAVVMVFFMTALSKGPLTLVDPLWACVYALSSAAVGMCLLREMPGVISLAGIALYLVGAFLMTRG